MRANLRQPVIRSTAVILSAGFLCVLASGTSRAQDCDENATLSIGHGRAPTGQVSVEVRGGSLCAATGFSMAIAHDGRRVDFVRAEPGPYLRERFGRGLIFHADGRNSQGFTTLFVVFGLTAPPAIIPEDSVLAIVHYRIKAGVQPGTVPLRNAHRQFGSPLVANIFTTPRSAINPELEHGSIEITDCDASATLSVGHASAPVGEVSVELRGGSFCPVTGLRATIRHDRNRVEFLRAEPGAFLKSLSGEPVFVAEEKNDNGFMSLRVAFDKPGSTTVTSISVPEDAILATLVYLIKPRVPHGTVPLNIEDEEIGNPPVATNVFTTRDAVLEPELEDGSITIEEIVVPVSDFTRGDADANGELEFADGVIMITLRAPGGQQPPCMDAADANDDGRVTLADALYMLDFLFGIGPPPPPPFTECGEDETADELSCLSFPACP